MKKQYKDNLRYLWQGILEYTFEECQDNQKEEVTGQGNKSTFGAVDNPEDV